MNWPITATALLMLGLLVGGCASSPVGQRNVAAQPALDARVSVGGRITNAVVISGHLLGITLFVANITSVDLYVPKHFNSNNYTFNTPSTSGGVHGDSWGATFEDFVLLKPKEATSVTFCFSFLEEAGEGHFSVHFYNSLTPGVERELRRTGIPFIIELSHSFGRIGVRASNPAGAGDGGIGVPFHSRPSFAAVPDQHR